MKKAKKTFIWRFKLIYKICGPLAYYGPKWSAPYLVGLIDLTNFIENNDDIYSDEKKDTGRDF